MNSFKMPSVNVNNSFKVPSGQLETASFTDSANNKNIESFKVPNVTDTQNEFGNTARDNILKFQLDNEVGAILACEQDTVNHTVTLTLLSATEQELSKQTFDVGSGSEPTECEKLTKVSLDHTNKRLVFEFDTERVLIASLSDLYGSKQDVISDLSTIRLNSLKGEEARTILSQKEAVWDSKSSVSVSDTGSTDERVTYITIDGVEKKMGVDFTEVQAKLTAGYGIELDDTTNVISVDEEFKNLDYEKLENKPSINGVELLGDLLGNKDLKLDIIEYMTYTEYSKITTKERKFYFVCKSAKDVTKENCWRIYLQNKLIGEWDIEGGMVTLPKFPMRFPFRMAGKWQ